MIADSVLANKGDYNFEVVSVLGRAEMLTESAIDKIHQVFKCPIYDRYSNMEMGIYAQRGYGKIYFKIKHLIFAKY